MLFAIDIGHNCPPDTGAVSGKYKEDELAKKVGESVIALLKNRGHKAVSVTPRNASSVNSSLRQRASKANSIGADYFISIHFNSFSKQTAHGTELYVYNYRSRAKNLARLVLNNIVSLGFRNRGIKYNSFAVLAQTSMPAMLIECCFISSDIDMRIFDAQAMAIAIVNGLIGEDKKEENISGVLKVLETTYTKPSTEQSEDLAAEYLYKITPGEYRGKLVAEEEGHYAVEFLQQIGDRKVHYIFSKHCEFIDD
ncbi:N-acetylmuramoyl-L-alanine amidase [Mastigocoleus testarum]|uniref:N-acetylmuramoyl-L-alanine amidase n=1 Tax=Mastigocoleus testarum TaxID=996925 RepID=UPI00040E191C|nr:N-acetylmuramoyl-L-alanine amidase [Mastigocoleus testarum]